MSDLAAVLLSVGEPFAERARASLRRQVLPPCQLVEIENVTPFHRALNAGARQVTAPFFVQVDADMILDPDCLATLRAAVRSDSGIVVGELRDALVGRVVGVKLFRTACFRDGGFADSISPDTDFGARLAGAGWRTLYVGRPAEGSGEPVRTLGEHRPEYTPPYTFRKHLLEGRRYWHRGAPQGLRWRLDALARSRHPLATFAQVALAHGLFLAENADALAPMADDPRAAWLAALLRAGAEGGARPAPLRVEPTHPLRKVFRESFELGRSLAAAEDGATLDATVRQLGAEGKHAHALVARIGLGHGVLSATSTVPGTGDEDLMRRFIVLGVGSRASLVHVTRARMRHVLDGLSGRHRAVRW
jgi:hypothetical protein